jgi:hypothetical protein
MFMSSVNYDENFQKNTEVNKFLFADWYMLDRDSWNPISKEIESHPVKWEDKKEVLYWRGFHTGLNLTEFEDF